MDNETIAKQLEQKRQSIQHVSFGIQPVCSFEFFLKKCIELCVGVVNASLTRLKSNVL